MIKMKQRAYRRKLNLKRGPEIIKRFRMLRWLQRGMRKANINGLFGKLGAASPYRFVSGDNLHENSDNNRRFYVMHQGSAFGKSTFEDIKKLITP